MTAHPTTALSLEDERMVSRRYIDGGDPDALHALVLSQFSLVRAMARSMVGLGVAREDLLAEGHLGLLDAARRFDPDRGARFSTYARWWVRYYMQRLVNDNRRIVPLPKTRNMTRIRLSKRRVSRDLERRLGRPPVPEELATALEVSVDELLTVERDHQGADIPISVGDPSIGHDPASGGSSPEQEMMAQRRQDSVEQMVKEALGSLDSRERRIVSDRMLTYEPRTLREIGEDLGVSRERVRQLERRALKKMRTVLEPLQPAV